MSTDAGKRVRQQELLDHSLIWDPMIRHRHCNPPAEYVIRPELQVFEANYDEILPVLQRLLEEAGLWARVKHDRPAYIHMSEGKKDKFERDDTWAVNIILMYIRPSLIDRLPIPRPVTAAQLLRRLETQCKPFRLMDLPRELRDAVYEYMVEDSHEVLDESHSRRGSDYSGVLREPQIRMLCAVSQEFREAVSREHYGNNYFELWNLPLSYLHIWASFVGMQNLRHIRSLNMRMQWGRKGDYDDIYVMCYTDTGLEAEVNRYDDYAREDASDCVREHCKRIDKLRREKQWDSTGVIEFFMHDTNALRCALWGPPVYEEDENEMLDERNAYQVAYGRSQVNVCCPW